MIGKTGDSLTILRVRPSEPAISPSLIAGTTALLSLSAYTLTLAPTFYNLDSAEFAIGVHTLGIVHATGYPLYLLLGRILLLRRFERRLSGALPSRGLSRQSRSRRARCGLVDGGNAHPVSPTRRRTAFRSARHQSLDDL